MKTQTFQDKSHYPHRGEWDNEPDKIQWVDFISGLDCLIVRNRGVGALCGYVGVPDGHPWFGKSYSCCTLPVPCQELYCDHSIDHDIDVHGGLTFSGFCDEGNDHGICHVPEPGRPARVSWFGFDCSHCFDLSPEYTENPMPEEVYRNVAYVRQQVQKLALQLHEVSTGKEHRK